MTSPGLHHPRVANNAALEQSRFRLRISQIYDYFVVLTL
jgi:hypothetical protein